MDLLILTSKKGTRVIKSTQLHQALGLNDNHYAQNVKRWLADVYQFSDGIRKPAGMTDYARAKTGNDTLLKEYYLSLELARLITLGSRSKRKQVIANKLVKEEAAFPQRVQLGAEDMFRLVEQTKAMSRTSCQLAAEKRHLAAYTRRRGSAEFWNHYRTEMTGYKKEDLIGRLRSRGISLKSSYSVRDLLLRDDPFELIRMGLADLYTAQGHPLGYALEIGRIGQQLAQKMNLEIVDDRRGEQLFAAPIDTDVLVGIRGAAA